MMARVAACRVVPCLQAIRAAVVTFRPRLSGDVRRRSFAPRLHAGCGGAQDDSDQVPSAGMPCSVLQGEDDRAFNDKRRPAGTGAAFRHQDGWGAEFAAMW